MNMVMESGTYDGDHWMPISRSVTTRHGWASPEDAVKAWRQQSSFKPYLNGRETQSAHDGLTFVQRVWFE